MAFKGYFSNGYVTMLVCDIPKKCGRYTEKHVGVLQSFCGRYTDQIVGDIPYRISGLLNLLWAIYRIFAVIC